MLKLKHVFKSYKEDKVLDDINISFPSTGLITIVGASGSGKSTLLNIIGGIDKPDSGTISLNNLDISRFNTKELDWYHDKCVGFIFQQYNLIEYLTVKENLQLINKDYEIVLFNLGIYHLKNKKVNKLSGGEKQRVAIARCILKNPSIYLCDEPTGALDTDNSIFIMQTLKELSKNHLVIVITHNMELANTYSDKIIHIKDGKIIDKLDSKDKSNITIEKVKPKSVFKIIINHLFNKIKRNILISLSFAIGLIALGLVLSISNGFKASLDKEEKESLSKYPIVISKTSSNLDDNTNELILIDNKVHSYNISNINVITNNYLDYLNSINNNLSFKIYKYDINGYYFNSLSLINTNNYYKEFDILYGNKIVDKYDVLLMVDDNNRINKYDMDVIGLTKESYDYKDLVNYSFNINKTKYTIKGIIRGKKDSILSGSTGLIVDNNSFINYIPDEIYLYPKDYDNKQIVINKLDNYKSIKYQDISTSIKSISNTLIDGISIVLSVFSFITLIVSSILISILTYINLMEYKHEIGIYKSIGMTDRNIKLIFYLENMIVTILSVIISILLIYLLTIPLNGAIDYLTGLSGVITINLSTFIILLIISLSLSMLSSFIPIKRISKLNIVDILRYE